MEQNQSDRAKLPNIGDKVFILSIQFDELGWTESFELGFLLEILKSSPASFDKIAETVTVRKITETNLLIVDNDYCYEIGEVFLSVNEVIAEVKKRIAEARKDLLSRSKVLGEIAQQAALLGEMQITS